MDFITGVWDYLYDSYMSTELDPRTMDWFIIKHEWFIYVVFSFYLYFVLRWGPNYMEKRKPYSLKTFIFYYNIFQIVYNTWIVLASIQNGMFTDIGLGCVFIDRSPVGKPMALVNVYYWTLMLKIIDLVETVIFVLRKKTRQISFLHLYHHVSTIYLAHASVKHYPGGMATFSVVVNSSVHVIMYTYYLLSSQGPKFQRLVNPIKPYITIIQMTQFFILLGHTLQGLLPFCGVPKWGAILLFANLIINFVLFYNFYRKNYDAVGKPKKS